MQIKGSWILAEAQNVGQSTPLQFNPLIHVVNKTNGFDVKHNYFDYSGRGECFFLLLLCVG